MNDTRESVHLEHFREICPAFPVGRVEKTESPDFVVHTRDGLIGIEHTEVFQPGPSHSGSLQAQDSLAYRVIRRSKELWKEIDGPPLLVQILFNPHIEIAKQNIENIAQSVVGTLTQVTVNSGDSRTLERSSFAQGHFPQAVVFIHIYRSRMGSGGENRWECSSVGFIPTLTSQNVQDVIDKKECKLDRYLLKCSEVWLLMVADALRIPSSVELDRSALSHCYMTRFDRIFFFWNADRKLIELNASVG